MKRVAFILCAIAAAAATEASIAAASAEPARQTRASQPAPYMRVFGSAAPPFGFVQFCERAPAECQPNGPSEPRFDATPDRLAELDAVNRYVNRVIAPATDAELYGVQEYWTLPFDKGDCEDYALLKRQILMRSGWPASALLMTVVRDERGDGHAVLTARTQQGDFILDNKVADVRLWHQTGYRYVMRQSYVDPRLWMSLAPDGSDRSAPLTAMPARR